MTKLYVGNLPFSATEDILKHIFENAGPVRSARIVMDLDGRSRGFGFVEMVTSKDAAEAIHRFNGDTYEGRLITVSYAKSRQSSGMFSEVQEHVLKTETS